MRIYDGSPRQDFEEVFRSIGAYLDRRGMREVLLAEVPDGFIVQGLVTAGTGSGGWSDSFGTVGKETVSFLDDDIGRFMDDGVARRAQGAASGGDGGGGYYESAFRVLGRYIDEQRPKDVFFFEQDGAFVVRLLMGGQSGARHVLAEFTREDIAEMVSRGPSLRQPDVAPDATAAQR